jgi:mannose-6-phosphate isomerase-like protein (cupin superfamily)
MIRPKQSRVVRLAEARRAIPGPAGEHSTQVLAHGTLDVRLAHAPPRPHRPTVHTKDEVYVVGRGRGVLVHDGARDAFEAGDLLFVAAGIEHHFEDYSDDLGVWVVFYGAEGGEVAND